ncbi:hypothetical protein SAMN05192551_101362 [Tindallia magadiensis]|uniref:Uncharacterized protein n=1 Tax=Tindallia magadiensis TaxID=69895 RepID=A0A1I3AR09_9FIRM|nr:hypothetical protein SAMN05192551_101362 [Tindallia magadiensis]
MQLLYKVRVNNMVSNEKSNINNDVRTITLV